MADQFEQLFRDNDNTKKKLDALWELWKLQYPTTREFTAICVDAGVWPDDDAEIRDLKIKARLPEVRAYLDYVNPITGIQNGYKTADGKRKPIQGCLFEDLAFDIESDCKQAGADRERIRQKIRVCLQIHKRRPRRVESWIWDTEDDASWNDRAA